jgi:hypothetical protein
MPLPSNARNFLQAQGCTLIPFSRECAYPTSKSAELSRGMHLG